MSAVGMIVLVGCADVAPPRSGSINTPAASGTPAIGELIGQGTVLQKDNEPPQFCLGGVAESYPPQCTGPVLRGWDWSTVDQFESASGVTWGAYAVQGTWDGSEFTRTGDPIPLSLYDTMPFVDPRLAEGSTGDGDEHQLTSIQAELSAARQPDVLESWISNGFLVITVPFDDGAIQQSLDEQYGQNLIIVQSVLRPAP
ncbi:hypothetical protein [Arthrobacter sp. H41]|uniref:hypothetical protein n=1 Tax=Arthrobacter sp. H41 TaxID=1312978 RepID=UPI0012DD056F|nr:hypothetical protein [Arthrobacter sp. H41]